MSERYDCPMTPRVCEEKERPCDFMGMHLSESMDFKFWRAVAGEFIGLTAFLWITISTVVFLNGSPAHLLSVALAFGVSISVLIAGFADISGGHLNPAVSMGLFLRGKISFVRLIMYTIAQCMGASFGSYLVKAADSTAYNLISGGANRVFLGSTGQAVMSEMIGTALLVFTVFAVCDNKKSTNYAGWLAIGLSVFLAHLALLGQTNCSINPARSFGAATISEYWTHHWVWWVGPYLGSLLSAVLYELFRFRKNVDY